MPLCYVMLFFGAACCDIQDTYKHLTKYLLICRSVTHYINVYGHMKEYVLIWCRYQILPRYRYVTKVGRAPPVIIILSIFRRS